ncbi:MAG TPA: ABC transporter permease [Clostridiaceae bacterium]|nr:ABC transporter permease [Clostridiaceae bacterium]
MSKKLGNIKARLSSSGSVFGLFLVYILLVILLSFLSKYFFQLSNFANIGISISVYGIAALGVTMIILSGGLDMSVAGNMALSNVISVLLLTKTDLSPYLIMIVCVLVGLIVGIINGFLVTAFDLHPTIVTLGTAGITRGTAFVICGGMSMMHDSKEIKFLGSGKILGIPVSLLFFVVLLIIMFLVLKYTTFGRSVYAIGGNRRASRLAGISVKKTQMLIFSISGMLAGIAALILTGTTGGGGGNAATGWESDIISAVLLGGTSIAGGKGTVFGTALGILFIGTLNNGMSLLGTNSYVQMILRGLVLIIAVVIDSVRNRKAIAK